MKIILRRLGFAIKGRSYSASAATKTAEQKTSHGLQVPKLTRMPNGMAVVSLETYSPLTSLAVVYNAGSRQESPADVGLTHCLRMAVTQSCQKASAFGIAKNLQQIGSTLRCTTSREQTIYSAQCLRDNITGVLELLNQVATSTVFKPWELDDSKKRLMIDLDAYSRNLDAVLMDAVHKAAFRYTLGRSLYMPRDRVGTYTPQSLEAFVQQHFVGQNAALVGIGIDHETLTHAARKLTARQGKAGDVAKAKYHGGGEIRIDGAGPMAHTAVIMEGVSLLSPDLPTIYVLQQALGSVPFVQYSERTSSKLCKAAAAVTNEPFTAQCITASYSDAGVFGLHAVASTFDIGKVLRAVVGSMKQLAQNGFSDAEIQTAKARVKFLLEISAENTMTQIESFGTQSFYTAQPLAGSQLAAGVDKVVTSDVNRLYKQLMSGKMSMGAVGNLVNTPYLDEL